MKNRVIRILLVDDDQDDYLLLQEMLSEIRDWKMNLTWISSYAEALRTIKADLFDVCLMDYRLDQGNGLELMHEFREMKVSLPIIILTGLGDHEIDVRAMQEGAADYLEKSHVNAPLLERSIRYALERERHLKALRRSERHLHVLSAKLMDAQESERKRLAQELHDSIGANLTAVKLSLERKLNEAKAGKAAAETTLLEQLVDTVENTIKDLKRIYRNLRPLILDDLGVLPAIRSLARQFSNVKPLVKLALSLPEEERNLPEPLQIVIYRLCQEALSNVSKHSDASLVEISMTYAEKTLALMVRDNGSGFDLQEVLFEDASRMKLGLESMKERVEMSGGALSIVSERGKGTTILATWPLL